MILLNDEPSVMHRFSQALSEILAANNGCGAVSLDFDCLLELPECEGSLSTPQYGGLPACKDSGAAGDGSGGWGTVSVTVFIL